MEEVSCIVLAVIKMVNLNISRINVISRATANRRKGFKTKTLTEEEKNSWLFPKKQKRSNARPKNRRDK